MKSIRWTPHARQEAALREILPEEGERTINHPDSVVTGHVRRRIFMRRYYDSVLQTEMLLRVVAEETENEIVVVTLYKTSKFKKYEEGKL